MILDGTAMLHLADETPIYRIFNVLDLVTCLDTKHLRLAQASLMEDKNELLGEYLAVFNSIFGPALASENTKYLAHRSTSQAAKYMTCWTQTHDNIALWSLYSTMRDGVMARSTVGKLRQAMNALLDGQSWVTAHSLAPNDPRNLFYPPKIGQVHYLNFSDLFENLVAIRSNYEKRVRDDHSLEALRAAMDWREASSKQVLLEQGVSAIDATLFKDRRYEHENEVRAIIELVRRDERTKEEYQKHPLAGLNDPVRTPPPTECPANIFVPIESDFIETLEMDGRMPPWQQDSLRALFARFGFEIRANTAFLAAPERDEWPKRVEDLFN